MNNNKLKQIFSRPLTLIILSAVLLTLSFPQANIWMFSWIGLVPLMRALDGKKLGQAFWTAYMGGLLFFSGTIYWFVHVTIFGAILLILYFAVYFGLFGLGYSYARDRSALFKLLVLPSWWVVLEFARGHLLTGFDWASLGYAQYTNLPVIQIADITGVFGVSFLIVMVNVGVKLCMEVRTVNKPRGFVYGWGMAGVPVFVLVMVLGYGGWRLHAFSQMQSSSSMAVTVIQANIPQAMKWESSAWPDIMRRYLALTRKAAMDHPDLIVWPETSFPGFLWEDDDLLQDIKTLVQQINTPLLFGSIVKEEGNYHNAAILLSGQGEVTQQYHKMHLVPFGEYIPLRRFFPFLERIVPISDFTPGTQRTVFGSHFSVLICFEDTVARLTRQFVGQGARWLINITNDAWFQDSKAPFMHLQGAVFRAVENRRSLVRAANTGVSCIIDPRGTIVRQVEDEHNKPTFVDGYAIATIYPNDAKTLYTKYGDIFAYLCFGCILIAILLRKPERPLKEGDL